MDKVNVVVSWNLEEQYLQPLPYVTPFGTWALTLEEWRKAKLVCYGCTEFQRYKNRCSSCTYKPVYNTHFLPKNLAYIYYDAAQAYLNSKGTKKHKYFRPSNKTPTGIDVCFRGKWISCIYKENNVRNVHCHVNHLTWLSEVQEQQRPTSPVPSSRNPEYRWWLTYEEVAELGLQSVDGWKTLIPPLMVPKNTPNNAVAVVMDGTQMNYLSIQYNVCLTGKMFLNIPKLNSKNSWAIKPKDEICAKEYLILAELHREKSKGFPPDEGYDSENLYIIGMK